MAEKPFPRTEAEINVFMQNLVVKLPALQPTLDLTALDITLLQESAANFNYLVNIAQTVSDTKEAFTDFKQEVFYGELYSEPVPPTFPVITPPETVSGGIVPWLKGLLKRIKAAPGYTEQIGEELGLIVDDPAALVPGDITPELTLISLDNGDIEIKFKKFGLPAIRVDWRRKGETDWNLAGVYTSSPAIHSHPSDPPGDAESREYRGVLMQKNTPVSKFSDISVIATNPN